MILVEPSWVLSVMLLAEPRSPYRATFEKTAEAVAKASNASPLFDGEHGAEKTAALIVAVGTFESGLRPDAEGDCDRTTKTGVCAPGGKPTSFCLLQLNQSNFKGLDVTREEIQQDVERCVGAGLRMMHASFRSCRTRPLEERLAWYAKGSEVCVANEDARKKSIHRMLRGMWLYQRISRSAGQEISRSAGQEISRSAGPPVGQTKKESE